MLSAKMNIPMVINKKYWFMAGVSILLSVVITYFLTSHFLQKQYVDDVSNSILYDMHGKFRVLKQANQVSINPRELKITIEREIAGDLIVLSTINPDIENILGTPLEALQQILDYEKTNGLLKSSNEKNDLQARDLAVKYLNKIDPDVQKRNNERKELIKNLGQHLRKQFPTTSKEDGK
jgi:hypothetical protein